MTDNQRERRGPFVGCLAVGLLLALPGYVLSVGPVDWLYNHGYLPEAVWYLYIPILYAYHNLTPVTQVLDWYVEVWR